MWKQYLIVFGALGFILVAFQNCSEIEFGVADLSRAVDPADAVCDPFANNDNSVTGSQNGLIGELRYLVMGVHGDSRSELNSRHLDYYMTQGIPADGVLFFSQVNTPTMSFINGFKNGAGIVLQNPVNMDDLVEYFSMAFESRLQLGMSDVEGSYQLALLSDDGSRLYKENDDGEWEMLIDNDGTHSARLICSTDTLDLTMNSAVPFRIQYFQGPRTEIAFQLLWRQVGDDDDLNDPLCGQTGSSTFFSGYQNGGDSVPTQAYQDFLDRGWKVVEAQNFLLPADVESNPCAGE